MTSKKGLFAALIIALVLLLDQAVKIYIKTHFEYNEEINMLGIEWARLHFIENEGMAFGFTLDWEYGKLMLSFLRVLMVAGLIWYMRMLIRENISFGFVACVALITAGALGNIIDSAVYAMIFTESPYHGGLATFTAFGQGYGQDMMLNGFMHGRVVDMLYFPMKWIHWPEWVPKIGGEEWLFFSPIFNIADAAITIGVFAIFLFQRHFFRHESAPLTKSPVQNTEESLSEGENTDTYINSSESSDETTSQEASAIDETPSTHATRDDAEKL